MNHTIKTMDVSVVAATESVYGAASLCGLLPPQTKLGRSTRYSQIQCRICRRKAAIRAGSPRGNQFGSGGPSRVDKEMIVLKKLMEELRMHEAKHAPPQHWKKWSVTCASDNLRWLQTMLVNSIPAIAALPLISSNVPAFMFLLCLSSLKYFKSHLLKSRWPWNF